jgi:hypothetical protein
MAKRKPKRVNRQKLIEELGDETTLTEAAVDPIDVELRDRASPPHEKFDTLVENSPDFEKTWRRTRKVPASWTDSEWDLSLASQAEAVGWTDQEICDLMVAHRRKHGGRGKDLQYYKRTIAKVRASRAVEVAAERREEAYEELETLSQSPNGRARSEQILRAFNDVLPAKCPNVKEVYQDGRDRVMTRYTLVFDNGLEMRAGPAADLISQDRFRESLATHTNTMLDGVKIPRWRAAVAALLSVAEVRELEETDPEKILVEWVRRYLQNTLTDDRHEALAMRDPFEEDGYVHIFVASFMRFIRGALRDNITQQDLIQVMKSTGFEQKTIGYRDGGISTSASYWRAPKARFVG